MENIQSRTRTGLGSTTTTVTLFVIVFVMCMSMDFVASSSLPLTPRVVSDEVVESIAVMRSNPGHSLDAVLDTRAIRKMSAAVLTPPSPTIPSPIDGPPSA